MTRVLVTGFEPFGDHAENPSQLLVEALDHPKAVLPVSYVRAADELRRAVTETNPDVVICFGLADDRTEITIERFAHNLDEATTTDNESAPGSGEPIDPGGPVAYRSRLPVDAIVEALRTEGIDASPSRDAGGFLCNHVFYVLMGLLEPHVIGGFVHVPNAPLEALVPAAEVIVQTCVRHTSSS